MLSQNSRNLIAVFIVLVIAFEMIAYVATTPRPGERFFQLYVLGPNRMAADYYPDNDPSIRTGESVRWYLGVTDFMGDTQLVMIRVKLGNQTIMPPDESQALPSEAPLIDEYPRFIQNNETWEFPFEWQILNVTAVGDSAYIQGLQINGETYEMRTPSASGGHNFRFIFELWTLDLESGALQFGWRSGGERRVAWLQLWFNATTTLA